MEFEPDVPVRCRDYTVGCIGAGMIMADCHLAAYAEARTTDIKTRFWGIDTLNHLVMRSPPPFRLASSLALGLLDRLPPARRALMQGLMESVPGGL